MGLFSDNSTSWLGRMMDRRPEEQPKRRRGPRRPVGTAAAAAADEQAREHLRNVIEEAAIEAIPAVPHPRPKPRARGRRAVPVAAPPVAAPKPAPAPKPVVQPPAVTADESYVGRGFKGGPPQRARGPLDRVLTPRPPEMPPAVPERAPTGFKGSYPGMTMVPGETRVPRRTAVPGSTAVPGRTVAPGRTMVPGSTPVEPPPYVLPSEPTPMEPPVGLTMVPGETKVPKMTPVPPLPTPPPSRPKMYEPTSADYSALIASEITGMDPRGSYAGSEVGAPKGLLANESGGNWKARNPSGAMGRFQFMPSRLADFTRQTGIEVNPAEFLNNPELQRKVETWHFNDIRADITRDGLDGYIGKEVAGVPITMDGMVAAAHLGGYGGMKKFIETGGKYNPKDSNGTHLSDYMARHQGNASAAGPYNVSYRPQPLPYPEEEAPAEFGSWMPEGFGADWVFADAERAPLVSGGKLRLGALLGLDKVPQEEQIARRLAVVGAVKDLQDSQRLTPYQKAVLRAQVDNENWSRGLETAKEQRAGEAHRLATDEVHRAREAEERDRAFREVLLEDSAPEESDAGPMPVGDAAAYKELYGDVGTAGLRERAERLRGAASKIQQAAELMGIVEEGFRMKALGSGLGEGDSVGKFLSYMGARAGLEGAEAQRSIRHIIQQQMPTQLFSIMDALKGSTSERDLQFILSTVPAVDDDEQVWRAYMDKIVNEAAHIMVENDPSLSFDRAHDWASKRFDFFKEKLAPGAREREEEESAASLMEKYRP